MRDRTKQRNFDFSAYPKTIEILDNLPKRNRVQYVAEAIEEKHNKESNPFTEEQQKVIDILIEEIRDIRDEIERLRR